MENEGEDMDLLDNFESGQQQLVQTRVMTTDFFGPFF